MADDQGHVERRDALGIVFLSLMTSILLPVALVIIMLMTSGGTFDYETGFKTLTLNIMFKVSIGVLILAFMAFLIAIFKDPDRSGVMAFVSLVLSGAVVAGYAGYDYLYKVNPPIHDVASDWTKPITLSDSLIRARGPKALPVEVDPSVSPDASIDWARRRVAEINAHTCPMLKTVMRHVDQAQVKQILESQGYQIFGSAQWRVEAIYTDPFFGFKSDIEVRLDPVRTDIRSISREQEADLGGNCARAVRIMNALRG